MLRSALRVNPTRSLAFSRQLACSTRAMSTTAGKKDTYTERQAKMGRPLSPHVLIYAFPIAAMSSVTNRVTGGALWAGITAIAGGALIGLDVPGLLSLVGSHSLIGAPAKMVGAFPLVYHYFGGLRHIVWDAKPELLTNKQVAESAWALYGTSAAISFVAGFITISSDKKDKK